jgi:DNA-binding PadR family transcriptional regulator
MTYAEIVILATLMSRVRHGYEIKKRAEIIFGDTYTINNNTLYTNLRRFQEMDAVECEVRQVSGKPDRHVYNITEKGREIFREMVLDFTPEMAKSDMEFYARVAFFHLLEPDERSKILKVRKEALQERLTRYAELCKVCALHKRVYDEKVVRFLGEQTKNEVQWVVSLESALEK